MRTSGKLSAMRWFARRIAAGWNGSRVALLVAAALALTASACASIDLEDEPEQVRQTPEATATATTAPAQETATATQEKATPPATPEPTPYDGELALMRIPSLGVEAPIEALGKVPGYNKLDVPRPRNVGWYHIYDKPGFGTNSIYSAHKDWFPDIRGPFYALTDLEDGDVVVVVMDDGREYIYEVFLQRRYIAGEVPMADLISPHEAEDPALRRPANEEWVVLITCGGEFVEANPDGSGYYVDRDVVIAKLVETKPGRTARAVEGGD